MNSSLQDCQMFLDLCQRCDSLDELSFKMSVMSIFVPDMHALMLYEEMNAIEKFDMRDKFWENHRALQHLQAEVLATLAVRCKGVNYTIFKFPRFSSFEFMLDVLRLIRYSRHEYNKKFIKTAIIDVMSGPKTVVFKKYAEFPELLARLQEIV